MGQNNSDCPLNIYCPGYTANNVTKLRNNASIGSKLVVFQVYLSIKLREVTLKDCPNWGHFFLCHFP